MIPFGRMIKYQNKKETSIKKVSSGNNYFVVLDSNGTLWGSGANNIYQFGAPEAKNYNNEWVKVQDSVKDVWCWYAYTIIKKTDDTLWITGVGAFTSTQVSGFTKLTTELGGLDPSTITNIYGGAGSLQAVVNNRDVYVAGYNVGGNNGVGISAGTVIPAFTRIYNLPASDVVSISVCGGSYSNFILFANGAVYCFGKNDKGELNRGGSTANPVMYPVLWYSGSYKALMTSSTGVVAIHINSNNFFICGNSASGQLGNGVTSSANQNQFSVTSVSTSAVVGTGTVLVAQRGNTNPSNSFINSAGVWVTGASPAFLGATGVVDNTVLGSFTRSNIPIPVTDIIHYSETSSSTIIGSDTELYQCGAATLIIDKTTTGTQIGFIKIRLPWEEA